MFFHYTVIIFLADEIMKDFSFYARFSARLFTMPTQIVCTGDQTELLTGFTVKKDLKPNRLARIDFIRYQFFDG